MFKRKLFERRYTCYGCGETELTYEEVCRHGREHAREELIKDMNAEGYY